MVVVLPERWRHALSDDAAGETIWNDRLETVADFDAHLSVVGHDEHDDTVIAIGLSYLPRLDQANRVVLDGNLVQCRHRRDDDLDRRLARDLREPGGEPCFLASRQNARSVDDAPRQSRQSRLLQEEREPEGDELQGHARTLTPVVLEVELDLWGLRGALLSLEVGRFLET